MVRDSWKKVVPCNIMVEFFSLDLKEWIHLNLKTKGDGSYIWRNMWEVACHTFWRNYEERDKDFVRYVDTTHYFSEAKGL